MKLEWVSSSSPNLNQSYETSFSVTAEKELVPGFIVNGTGNSGAVITAYLFVVGSITGSAYGFTATVGLQMCLLDGGANAQCYPNVPEPLFTQSNRDFSSQCIANNLIPTRPPSGGGGGSNAGAVAGGVIAALVVVGGAVGAVLFLKFKKPEVYKRVLGRLANVVGNNSKSPKKEGKSEGKSASGSPTSSKPVPSDVEDAQVFVENPLRAPGPR